MKRTLMNALGFVLGFTVLFVLMGALAGTVGSFLLEHKTIVNIVSGLIVIFFGLNFMGVFHIQLFKGMQNKMHTDNLGFFSSVLFGIIFSVGWTPCVGAFLGSALMMASGQGNVLAGVIMLLCYSLGLGIPFILSALLIEQLKGAFTWIKKHYNIINMICGLFLILVGVLMMTGTLGRLLTFLS